jgi:hypothetical protein
MDTSSNMSIPMGRRQILFLIVMHQLGKVMIQWWFESSCQAATFSTPMLVTKINAFAGLMDSG